MVFRSRIITKRKKNNTYFRLLAISFKRMMYSVCLCLFLLIRKELLVKKLKYWSFNIFNTNSNCLGQEDWKMMSVWMFCSVHYGQISTLKTPILVRSPKLSNVDLGQYFGYRLRTPGTCKQPSTIQNKFRLSLTHKVLISRKNKQINQQTYKLLHHGISNWTLYRSVVHVLLIFSWLVSF